MCSMVSSKKLSLNLENDVQGSSTEQGAPCPVRRDYPESQLLNLQDSDCYISLSDNTCIIIYARPLENDADITSCATHQRPCRPKIDESCIDS